MIQTDSSADVVMLGTFSAWKLGTLQARALPLAAALKVHGVDVAIVTTPWDAPGESRIIDIRDGIPIFNTGHISSRFPLPAVQEQLALVRRLRPSLVHVMKPRGFGGLSGRALSGRIPVLVDADDWEGDGGWNDSGKYSWPQQRLFHYQEISLLRRADIVTAASTLLAHRASMLRNDEDSVYVVANGLPIDRQQALAEARRRRPSEIDPPVVVLYSRFEEFGDDWLHDFIAHLSNLVDHQVTLRLIGPSTRTTSAVEGLGLVNMEPLGYVAYDAVPEAIASTSVAVYPYVDSLITRSKQSVKLIELIAAGCPVVASDVGEVPHTLGPAGVLVDGANPAAFAREVAHLLACPERLDSMSARAQERARSRFGLDTIATSLYSAYLAGGLH